MRTFDDTQWDIEATGAILAQLNKKCRDLERRVKYPARFPIAPLDSTLARVRAKNDTRRKREVLAEIDGNVKSTEAPQVDKLVSTDGYGRTRAAAKRLSATANSNKPAAAKGSADEGKVGLKRKRPQEQEKRRVKSNKSKAFL